MEKRVYAWKCINYLGWAHYNMFKHYAVEHKLYESLTKSS